jgi:hypothetical protein
LVEAYQTLREILKRNFSDISFAEELTKERFMELSLEDLRRMDEAFSDLSVLLPELKEEDE